MKFDSPSSIGEMAGILSFETRGENPEEEAFIRKIKRKRNENETSMDKVLFKTNNKIRRVQSYTL